MINKIFPKIHNEGYRFLIISGIITIILLLFSNFLGLIGIFLTIWVYYFFRDPDRAIIEDDNYLVSPADGVISQIIEMDGPKELGLENEKLTRVSIFMNVFDCHVNRFPCSGKVDEIFYKPGKFLNASLDKSSDENERNFIKFSGSNGTLAIVQIAGLIARRIVCDCHKDQEIKQGQKLGIIRFGSRVDMYFKDYNILVKKNQNAISGETLIARKL